MELGIELVPKEQKQIISRLMQFYLYDFTRYLELQVDRDGLFPSYPGLEAYWNSGLNKFAYLFTVDGNIAGFALVDRLLRDPEGQFYMTEFFVMQKYRRSGVGTWAAHRLFDMFPGDWKVSQIRANTPARNFWHRVIGSYTGGEFQERFNSRQGNPSQYFSTLNTNRIKK
ncbi:MULTISPECIES: GNAT family N-acetyltransferase [Paenibacillus]|jgi:predicted acetyltransferase|uniref:GNAT family N-acetyltransferase n=1 Tax=Paenibacillus phytohabitans TaxID=2654978 RepID=A0ABX1YCY2_9BACL|nr:MULTISPECIES: GNAT family N-acetyltransferase [Paenibacillus]AIQ30236.1 GNAT family acetyltransferase [Paenibacillus sp. FSL P4-0081]KHL95130.1 GNAT family acetyltransferase [Paenibacillus sp. IHB B 3415]NOU77659.1 GNAT family N-acetyltransferase [Paenibacillus phytohabitans]OMF31126.1 GNAT family N-acetyltransferase [Paenibacillus sp. FSL H8-0259]